MANAVGDSMNSSIRNVTSKDGSFYTGGHKTNLSTIMMNLMIKRVGSVDGVLTGMINEMNNNNRQTKLMNDYLSGLREMRPTGADDVVKLNKLSNLDIKINRESSDGSGNEEVNPNEDWSLGIGFREGKPGYKSQFTQSEIDQQIEVMKSKISSVNSNQQMAQIKLEKYNNVRNESMQMVSTIMKSSNQLLLSIINNFP